MATPDWAKTPGSGAAAAPAPAPAAAAAPAAGGAPQGAPQQQKKGGIRNWSGDKVVAVMRMGNFFNGVAMIVAAVLALVTGVVGLDFQVFLLSIYITLFGLLLMCTECHLGFLDKRIRKYFGFLYGYMGRTLFILFAASINFAMDQWLGYLVGIGTFLNAIFNFWVIKFHPGFKAAGFAASDDPYSTYTGGDAEMRAYLRNHPKLAQKAISAGVSIAQQNPAVAQQVVGAAASAAVNNQRHARGSDNPFDAPGSRV